MKKVYIILLLVFGSIYYSSAQTVSPDSAKYFEDSIITVCGKVEGTFTTKSGVVMLSIGAAYPKNPFTVVIFKSDVPKFKYKPAEYLKGKNICITGQVVIFKEKPEIIAKQSSQIKIQ